MNGRSTASSRLYLGPLSLEKLSTHSPRRPTIPTTSRFVLTIEHKLLVHLDTDVPTPPIRQTVIIDGNDQHGNPILR